MKFERQCSQYLELNPTGAEFCLTFLASKKVQLSRAGTNFTIFNQKSNLGKLHVKIIRETRTHNQKI